MSDRKQALREHLNATRQSVLSLIASLQSQDWDKPVQGDDGRWTVKQVMLHLAASESGQIGTAKAIADEQPTLPDNFDLNRYNQRQVEKNAAKAPPEILSGLAESRQKLLAYLDEVSETDFDKRGQHARGDMLTLEQLFYRIGEHEAEHAELIRQALGKYSNVQRAG